MDEVNRVTAGFNSGWTDLMGPDALDPQGVADLFHMPGAGITYGDPEFSFLDTNAPTAIVFPSGSSLGPHYDDVAIVADSNLGQLYALPLDAPRTGFALAGALADRVADTQTEANALRIGQGFGSITDLEIAPDGDLYVVCDRGRDRVPDLRPAARGADASRCRRNRRRRAARRGRHLFRPRPPPPIRGLNREEPALSKVPSIKATGFQSAGDDLCKLVETGVIPRAELEAKLEPGDLRYLDKQLAASMWVPIDTYRRVVELLVEYEAPGSAEAYLHERGMRAGERLHKAGLYRQFEASTEVWGNRVGSIATTMSAVIYNFTRWTFEMAGDERSFRIIVDDAEHFPEISRFTTQGFIEYTSRAVSGNFDRVKSERVKPGRIVFTGTRAK